MRYSSTELPCTSVHTIYLLLIRVISFTSHTRKVVAKEEKKEHKQLLVSHA